MNGFGFSLKRLLAVLTFAAVGLTALFNASEVWESTIGLATAIFLLTTVVAAVYSRGRRRAIWVGCAVFGWGYLVIADNPLRDYERHPTLLTHVALDALHETRTEDLSSVVARARSESPDPLSGDEISQIQVELFQTRMSLYRTGHYLFAWIFAVLGGFVGSYFYAKRNPGSED